MRWTDTLRKNSERYYLLSAESRYSYHLREMKEAKKDYKEYWYESDRFGTQVKRVYGGRYNFHKLMAEKAKEGRPTRHEPMNGYEEYESEEYKNADNTKHLSYDPFNLQAQKYNEG